MADDTPGIVEKSKSHWRRLRRHVPLLDHVVNMLSHYSNVQGGILSGATTYYGFLSFFPLLALAFAIVGFIANFYPGAEHNLVTAIQQVFPNIVTLHGGGNSISMDQIKNAKAATGIIGLVGLLYSGLNWMSGLRQAMAAAFQIPPSQRRNFLKGKAVDLASMVGLGIILLVSVGAVSVVKGLANRLLDWINLKGTWIGTPLVWVVGILIGLAASTLLFYLIYRVMGDPKSKHKPLWQGALLAAIGFEVLKILVVNVLGALGGSSFAPLAIAVTLVVWINYFSRLTVYGAAWAMTAGESATELQLHDAQALARDAREQVDEKADGSGAAQPGLDGASGHHDAVGATGTARLDPGSAIIGAAAGAAAVLTLRRRR